MSKKFAQQLHKHISIYIYIYSHKPTWHNDTKVVTNTGKPAHVVTSIKQSPVLKVHLFVVLS
jgi:hypothetical protein